MLSVRNTAGVVVHACHLSARGRIRREDCKFKASLGYFAISQQVWNIARPCFENIKEERKGERVGVATSLVRHGKVPEVREETLRRQLSHVTEGLHAIPRRLN